MSQRFWLIHNLTTDPGQHFLSQVYGQLKQHPVQVETFAVTDRECPDFSETHQSPDMVIIIGGDGTVLRTIQALSRQSVPVVAINTGKLGFLTHIDPNNLAQAIDALVAGNYHLEDRAMLSAQVIRKEGTTEPKLALNDALIKSMNPSQMSSFSLHINGHFLAHYDADGLIVATPTGTTAYNLSAGGPIIAPTVDAVAITPICPHSLSAKPVVIPANETIDVVSHDPHAPLVLSLDGQEHDTIQSGESIQIKKSALTVPFVNFGDGSDVFYQLLTDKLHWGMNPRWKSGGGKRTPSTIPKVNLT